MKRFLYLIRRALLELLEDKDALIFPIMLLATIGAGASLFLKGNDFLDPKLLGFALATLGMTFAVFMLRFLTGKSIESTSSEREAARFRRWEIEREIFELRRKENLSEAQHQEFIEAITTRINNTAVETYLDQIRSSLIEKDFLLTIGSRSDETLRRIYREIEALTRRATLNLVLGVVTAVSGILLLSYIVLGEGKSITNLTDFTISFIPRLSIVTIIEVFAYFFLRLYKSSLNEIKYFQNEATNIEFHFTALLSALKEKNPELMKETVLSFLRTDRNPLLVGDQKSQSLESDKLYSTPISLSAQHLDAILNAITKQNKNT